MDWKNVDLNSPYERNQEILDGYSFETLLLEIHTNLRVINEQTVRAQFELELKSKIDSAREIFEANLANIVTEAIKERNKE
jgi:hypothetical protein